MLAVRDTGIGLTTEVLEHVFDPFFAARPVGQGNELGLGIVCGPARQLGGHARIDSEPGHGTTVTLYLPKTDAEPTPHRTPATAEVPAVAGQRVLPVEDEADLRDVTGRILTKPYTRNTLGAFIRRALNP